MEPDELDPPLRALVDGGTPAEPIFVIAAQAREATLEALPRGPLAALLAAAAVGEAALAAMRAEQRRRSLPVAPIACRRGCSHCCHLRVEVTRVEAIALATFARTDPTLASRVRATAAEVGALEHDARLTAQAPCAFLTDDGACSAHEVRPLVCRAAVSTSAEACARELGPRRETGVVPVELSAFVAMRAAYLGFRQALGVDEGGPERRELHVLVAEELSRNAPG